MFIIQTSLPLSHGFITMDWLFLRSFSASFIFNVRLLSIQPNSCSIRVKKLIRVLLSDRGGIKFAVS